MRHNVRRAFENEITLNLWMWAALGLCLVPVLTAVQVPVLSDVLQHVDPGAEGWVLITVASLFPLVVAPVVKRMTD